MFQKQWQYNNSEITEGQNKPPNEQICFDGGQKQSYFIKQFEIQKKNVLKGIYFILALFQRENENSGLKVKKMS